MLHCWGLTQTASSEPCGLRRCQTHRTPAVAWFGGWAPFRIHTPHPLFRGGALGLPAGDLCAAAALLPEGLLLTVDSRHTSHRRALGWSQSSS